MNIFKDPKTNERVGVFLLCGILILTGLILLNDKSTPITYSQSKEDISTEKTPTSQNVEKKIEQEKININKASIEDLDKLPGIGEKTAQKIIEYREIHGVFGSTESIMEVSGIGEAKYEAIKELISI